MTLKFKILNTESNCMYNSSFSKNENMSRIYMKASLVSFLFLIYFVKTLKTIKVKSQVAYNK